MTRKCIIVLGPFRSGTSLICNVISHFGYSPGPRDYLFTPSDWNPDGYFQRRDITEFNTQLIETAGGSISCPPPFDLYKRCPPSLSKAIDLAWAARESKFVIKDPRLCITLYYWCKYMLLTDIEVHCVRTSRNLDDVIASCLQHPDVKLHFRGSHRRAKDAIDFYERSADWCTEALNSPTIRMPYEALVNNSRSAVTELYDFLCIYDQAKLDAALDSIKTGRSFLSSKENGRGS